MRKCATAPTISVVCATYNRAARLKSALDGLRRQDYMPGDEVIVVDNGSVDSTAAVIQAAAEVFPVPLKKLVEPRRGKGPALDVGIAAAHGEILALMDDDVVVDPHWVATIRELFSDPSLALIGGRVDPDWECPPPRWFHFKPQAPYGLMTSPLALQHYGMDQELGLRTAVGANMATRRDVVDALGGFRPDLARRAGTLFGVEDQDFCHRARRAGYRCEYRSALRVRHWVPAERLRLLYFARWFFWSGYGNALLGTDDRVGRDNRRQPVPWYYARRVAIAITLAVADAALGRVGEAAEKAMEAAYGLGYVAQRTTCRLTQAFKTVGVLLISALALSAPRANMRLRDMFPWQCRPARVARTSQDFSVSGVGRHLAGILVSGRQIRPVAGRSPYAPVVRRTGEKFRSFQACPERIVRHT